MTTKNAILYVRASTSEVRQSNSHEIQLRAINEFAQENDCFIISYRVDRLSRSLTCFNRIAPHLHRLRFAGQGDQELNLIVISVLLSIAHAESKANSERVKMAYKTIKAKDPNFKWGSQITDEVRQKSTEVRKFNAQQFNTYILSVVSDLKNAGYAMSDIPNRLNQLNIFTRRGKVWKYHNLMRLIRSMEVQNA